jgi:hypothetical protein
LADRRSGHPGIHLVLHGALLDEIDADALAVSCIPERFRPPRRDFIAGGNSTLRPSPRAKFFKSLTELRCGNENADGMP